MSHSGKGNGFPRGAPHPPCIERLMASLAFQRHCSLAWNPWAVVCVLEDKAFLATLTVVILVTTIISRQQDARSFEAGYLDSL